MKKIRAVLATIIMLSAPCHSIFARRGGFGAGLATGMITGAVVTSIATRSPRSSRDTRHLREDVNNNIRDIQTLNDSINRLRDEIDRLKRELKRR